MEVEKKSEAGRKACCEKSAEVVIDMDTSLYVKKLLKQDVLRSIKGLNWKKVRTRFSNLCKCGIDRRKAWEWANTRKGYWRIADSFILHRALHNDNLKRANYPFLLDCYGKIVS